jgi:hypothetical protein
LKSSLTWSIDFSPWTLLSLVRIFTVPFSLSFSPTTAIKTKRRWNTQKLSWKEYNIVSDWKIQNSRSSIHFLKVEKGHGFHKRLETFVNFGFSILKQ